MPDTKNVICEYKKKIKIFIYLFLKRGQGRKKERERNNDVREKHQLIAPGTRPHRDQTHNSGACPDWESKHRPFALRVDAPAT